ncbi:MAG TPA: 50S ribosomal protein L18 [Candidatus Krumholzibacteria bacterium]|nr:50S ribosomal protein L18 [Candidatus Krumholzibacteria bacterium]
MQKKFKTIEDYKRWRRHKRVRNRVVGTMERPRVCVFRSNQHIYAQLIDDETGRTLLAVSSLKMEAPAAAKKAEAKAEKADAKAEGKKGGKAAKADKPAKGEKAAAPAGGKKTALAREVGRLLAEAAQAKGFKKVAFDRGGYLYHGRVAALATSAREHGLDF